MSIALAINEAVEVESIFKIFKMFFWCSKRITRFVWLLGVKLHLEITGGTALGMRRCHCGIDFDFSKIRNPC